MKIKDLPKVDRPREKLEKYGPVNETNMARIWNKHKLNTTLKPKVFVALSGGVDSAVAAALLKKQGYRVIAFFMKNWSGTFGLKESECPWVQDRQDAMTVAAKLDIPFHTLDFEKEYKREVLDYFFREYKAGRTPNPDVLCNSQIKFGAFLKKAMELGTDYIATGHYARLMKNTNNQTPPLRTPSPRLWSVSDQGYGGQANTKKTPITKHQLLVAVDNNKDQSYFLHRLNQSQLSRAMFPIGDYTKPQVRAMAKKFGLPNWDKKDSQGLCFVGHIRLKQFLSQKIKERPGEIVWIPHSRWTSGRNDKETDGKVVGEHKGLFWYTIGQRQGIGIGGIGPFYVVEKDLANNWLIVTRDPRDARLFRKEVYFTDANWIDGGEPKFPLRCHGRIRYRESLVRCEVRKVCHPSRPAFCGAQGRPEGAEGDRGISEIPRRPPNRRAPRNDKRDVASRQDVIYCAAFVRPVWAPAAGQSIVFYKGDVCLGGGVIV